MEWLTNFLNGNPITALFVPTALGGISFIGNLAIAMSDGVITDAEFHSLATSANGAQLVILIALMVFMKLKKPNTPAK